LFREQGDGYQEKSEQQVYLGATCEDYWYPVEQGEQCDGGFGCQDDCTCGGDTAPTDPLSVDCKASTCYNPLTPLNINLDTNITAPLANSQVEFHALLSHQSNSTSGTVSTQFLCFVYLGVLFLL
jgi:hypothetical protein